MKNYTKQILFAFVIILTVSTINANLLADIVRNKDGKSNEIQRTPNNTFDLQQNTVSNMQFYTTNYGIFGLNVARTEGGGYWPRGSRNQYIFGGGIWFGTVKERLLNDTITSRRMVSVTYNPNNARSWMVPGLLDTNKKETRVDKSDFKKYRTYFSTDFSPTSGEALNPQDGPAWPIWDTGGDTDTLKRNRYFGFYVDDIDKRNVSNYKKGPAYISGEDIFATYHDADLSYYDGGEKERRSQGYPLNIQYEQYIYSWGFGDYQNFIFIRYDIINRNKFSDDSLTNRLNTFKDCWMAPIIDVDIARAPAVNIGATNDRVRFNETDPSLNMAFQWSNGEYGEAGNGFGYLGYDFLESPAVIKHYVIDPITGDKIEVKKPDTDFVRKDRATYPNEEQLGLVTFRNWSIADDKILDEDRYLYIAGRLRDGDTGPGDKRFMMATGPYHLRPGDTSKVVIGMMIANGTKGKDADGTEEDISGLIALDKFAQAVYDNSFRAPQPPDRTRFTESTALNHGVIVTWDSSAEISNDLDEKGLDFMGYVLYRARNTDLDTFSLSNISANNQYSKGAGPLGWKAINAWALPRAYEKSNFPQTKNIVNGLDLFPQIDSMRIIGPYVDGTGKVVDTMAIRIMKVGKGLVMIPDSFSLRTTNTLVPQIAAIDTFASADPWGKYYASLVPNATFPMKWSSNNSNRLFNEALVGVVNINKALDLVNPLYYRRKTIEITDADFARVRAKNGKIKPTQEFIDTLKSYLSKPGFRVDSLDANGKVVTRLLNIDGPIIDSLYFINTYRKGPNNALIDVFVKRPISQQMNEVTHINEVLDSIYSYLKQGLATIDMPDFEGSNEVRTKVISAYMSSITNGRQYIDIGDDDRNSIIDYNADPTKTEKLINNVPYSYKIIAFDEGDFQLKTPAKVNQSQNGLSNQTVAYPKAAPVGAKPTFEILTKDVSLLGGVNNLKFYSVDDDRVIQNFLGDTLEIEWKPTWFVTQITASGTGATPVSFGVYSRQITLVNKSKNNQVLFNGLSYTGFESELCNFNYTSLLTDYTVNYSGGRRGVVIDTLPDETVSINTFGYEFSKDSIEKRGFITTGNFADEFYCYAQSLRQPALGSLGFSYDFNLMQYGGMFRGDSATYMQPGKTAVTNVAFIDGTYDQKDLVFNTSLQYFVTTGIQWVTSALNPQPIGGIGFSNGFPVYSGFNNGPGEYLVEFLPGGTEPVRLSFDGVPSAGLANLNEASWNVDYLNLKITNLKEHKFITNTGQEQIVKYPYELPHMELPDTAGARTNVGISAIYQPDPRNLGFTINDPNSKFYGVQPSSFIDHFNISSYAYVNSRKSRSVIGIKRMYGRPAVGPLRFIENTYAGLQGRYYKSAIGKDTKANADAQLDFVHLLNIGGVQFALDYANTGRPNKVSRLWDTIPGYTYGEDFKAGDKIILKTTGGVFGLPAPGAKVQVRVTASSNPDKPTDEELDQIKVVPNPYFISHEGQRSSYEPKLYFTKLPKQCTIEIYTVTGDLIRTLEHNDLTSTDAEKEGIEVWDLLSKNKLRIQSQSFLAYIKTKDGAQSIQKFSIVVGGFRLLDN